MKLLHLDHIEDIIFDGHFIHAFDTLSALSEAVMGDVPKYLAVSEKFDGAPAIVFGTHPDSGVPFIGTKSVFNKRTPKIAYNAADIDKFYGDKPELANKLKLVAHSIKSFPPGVWQADLMWTDETFDECDRLISFCENTITYYLEASHPEARYMSQATVGLVVHTKYIAEDLEDSYAVPVTKEDVHSFAMHKNDAYFIDPIIDLNKTKVISDEMRVDINSHIDWLDQIDQSNAFRASMQKMKHHAETLKMFINYCVRMGESNPSTSMYRTFLRNRSDGFVCHSFPHEQNPIFDCIFAVHERMTALKKILIDVLSSKPQFYTEVGGKWVKNEGFVVTYHGTSVKLVDRLEFSRLNFMNKKFEKTA